MSLVYYSFNFFKDTVYAAKVMLLMNSVTTFLSCCWSNTLCSSHFYYDLWQNNSCTWFFVTNLVFNLAICHFKWVFSDCAGKAGLRFKCGSVGRSDFKCCEWVILPGHFLSKSLWVKPCAVPCTLVEDHGPVRMHLAPCARLGFQSYPVHCDSPMHAAWQSRLVDAMITWHCCPAAGQLTLVFACSVNVSVQSTDRQ